MDTERALNSCLGNPFTALLAQDGKLRNIQEDIDAMSRHTTHGVPDERYLDLADELLHQGKYEPAHLESNTIVELTKVVHRI